MQIISFYFKKLLRYIIMWHYFFQDIAFRFRNLCVSLQATLSFFSKHQKSQHGNGELQCFLPIDCGGFYHSTSDLVAEILSTSNCDYEVKYLNEAVEKWKIFWPEIPDTLIITEVPSLAVTQPESGAQLRVLSLQMRTLLTYCLRNKFVQVLSFAIHMGVCGCIL